MRGGRGEEEERMRGGGRGEKEERKKESNTCISMQCHTVCSTQHTAHSMLSLSSLHSSSLTICEMMTNIIGVALFIS